MRVWNSWGDKIGGYIRGWRIKNFMYKVAVQIKNIKLKNCLKLPLLGPDIKKMTIWFKSFQFILFKFQIHTQPAFTCSKLTTETLEHVIAGLVTSGGCLYWNHYKKYINVSDHFFNNVRLKLQVFVGFEISS